MKTIALVMAYNEGELVYRCLENIIDSVDQVVVFEGTVSPFDDQPEHSQDNTLEEIRRFIRNRGNNKIILWSPPKNTDIKTREHYEAWVKNEMLAMSSIEHGDLIYMCDVDEFFKPDNLDYILTQFALNDKMNHAAIEEYQFAYNMHLWFKASHNGRFLRYLKGSKYSASQHFIHPNGKDATRVIDYLFIRETAQMYHLCWVKHPELIRQKVLTFKRPSFTAWYNNCYLVWPNSSKVAYLNNKTISQQCGWPGGGFAEGQSEPLMPFVGSLPVVLYGYNPDYFEYIRNNMNELVIR